MKNWRQLKVGDNVVYHFDDFDGKGCFPGVVTSVDIDHAIVDSCGIHLWIDDDTEGMVEK